MPLKISLEGKNQQTCYLNKLGCTLGYQGASFQIGTLDFSTYSGLKYERIWKQS